jgi:hypothetical protein
LRRWISSGVFCRRWVTIATHLRANKENDFLVLDKKIAHADDVVASQKDLQQVSACLDRLGRLKRLTERFLDDYVPQQKGDSSQFFSSEGKNPFTGDVGSLA